MTTLDEIKARADAATPGYEQRRPHCPRSSHRNIGGPMSANMEGVIAAALAGHERKRGIRDAAIHCTCGWAESIVGMRSSKGSFATHQARAVLAALEGAGHVEWGTGEGVKLMTWRDRGQAERQSASATKSTDGGKTWQHTNPPVVSRITGPWTAVEG